MATFLRLHREGYKPKRDLILALTADEEGGKFNGASWLVNEHRDLVDAAYVINPDSGGVELDHGRAEVADVEATEKVYADYQVTATDRGGHSSLPRPDNAIYELTNALEKLAHYNFPFELNEVTRTYFGNLEKAETGQTAADIRAILSDPPDMDAATRLSAEEPSFNSNFRTTCVATRLAAGHANNALPQTAEGQCELPHLSRPFARGDSAEAHRDLQRSEADGEVRFRRRRGDGRGPGAQGNCAGKTDS